MRLESTAISLEQDADRSVFRVYDPIFPDPGSTTVSTSSGLSPSCANSRTPKGAGSGANNSATANSDIDVVIDGDSMRMDVAEYIKNLFNIPVDILWLELLKEDDEELESCKYIKSKIETEEQTG